MRENEQFIGQELQAICTLLYRQDVKDLLEKQKAVWFAHHKAGCGLPIGFFSISQGKAELRKVDFLGISKCLGIFIPRTGISEQENLTTLKEIERNIRQQNPSLGEFTILVGSLTAVKNLAEGITPPEALNNITKNGEAPKNQTLSPEIPVEKSTFLKQPEIEENPLLQRTIALLENPESKSVLAEMSITTTKKGQLDFLFVAEGEKGEVRLVNIRNLRVGKIVKTKKTNEEGKEQVVETLEESVESEGVCAGIYVPDTLKIEEEIFKDHPSLNTADRKKIEEEMLREGLDLTSHLEDLQQRVSQEISDREAALRELVKRRVYTTAEHMRRSLVPSLRTPPESGKKEFHIAVAIEGQLSLWEKIGFLTDIPPYREGAIPPREVINFLFFDEEGKREGPLARLGITFRTRGVLAEGLDITFYKKDPEGVAQPCGITIWGLGKDLQRLQLYNNVYGLIFFEQDLPLEERKKITRRISSLVRYWLNDPRAEILGVDKNLLRAWKTRGNPLPSREEVSDELERMGAKKRIDYGFGPTGPTDSADIFLFEPIGQQIGGNQIALVCSYPGGIKTATWFDFGWPYGAESTFSVFPNRASRALGLGPYLEAGILPKLRRLYRTDLLEMSLSFRAILAALNGDTYVLGELYHRFGWDQLEEMIGGLLEEEHISFSELPTLKNILQENESKHYEAEKVLYLIWLLSHSHQDHTGAGFALRDEIPIGFTPASYAFLQAIFRTGWHYSTQEIILRRLKKEGKGRAQYDVYERPTVLFDDGQSRMIGPDLEATAHWVNHSIEGATAYKVAILDSLRTPRAIVGYTGDFCEGPLTEEMIKAMREVNVLITEVTNLSETPKPSIGVTEDQVRENIKAKRKEADDAGAIFIVQFPPNHLKRLRGIIEASQGRTVCVTLEVAQILQEFAILNEGLPPERKIDVPRLGKDVLIYKHLKMLYDPWEEQLIATYGAVTPDQIFSDPRRFTLTTSPYKLLINILGGLVPENVNAIVVRSSYWPYSRGDKAIVLSNLRYCQKHDKGRTRFKYYADIKLERNAVQLPDGPGLYHASGHVPPKKLWEFLHYIVSGGNVKTIIPVHTERRGFFATEAYRRLRELGVEVGGLDIIKRGRSGSFRIPIPF